MGLSWLPLLSIMSGPIITGDTPAKICMISSLITCRYKATLAPEVRARLEDGDPHVITTHQMGDALLKLDFAEDSRR